MRIKKADLLEQLPQPWPEDVCPRIESEVRKSGRVIVVLDDDPTGTQTVHGISILTEWSCEAIENEFLRLSAGASPLFYILTNSRSLPVDRAQQLGRKIGANLREAARRTRTSFVVVSRSDSTLRGHFPEEVDSLAEALGLTQLPCLLVPCFFEGGRLTAGDVHYVAQGEWLVPAAETESARDAAFGFQASNLRDWVAEKTSGRVPAAEVASVSLEDIRRGGPERVAQRLVSLSDGSVCAVNAVCRDDLEVFVLGLLLAEARGRRFLYRTAASFVPVRAGLQQRNLLEPEALAMSQGHGGLIVIGSYVPRTTIQLEELKHHPRVTCIELHAEAVLDPERRAGEIRRASGAADDVLRADGHVAVYTSRNLITGPDASASLDIGGQVSSALVEVTRGIDMRPRYIIAKGGITSSDLAKEGLGIRRATVLGQLYPGIPVWQLGPESRYPEMPYVVFPGNVGEPETLCRLVDRLNHLPTAMAQSDW